jgi:hypothetical protein
MYGTTAGSYTASSTLDNGLVTTHSTTLTGLSANTTYHFAVMSMNASSTATTSMDMLFTTTVSSSTSTTTPGDDISFLQTQITDLQNQVNMLKAQIAALIAQIGNGGGDNGSGGGTGTTTPPVTPGAGTIDQNNTTASAGGSIDFGGHNFGREEHVSIKLNGSTVGDAFTNSSGSFSTGALSVPNTPGSTATYTFTGQSSGITSTATLTIH